MKKHFFRNIAICVFSFISATCYAEDQPIGQTVWTKGKVTAVSADNKERELTRRSAIYEQDTIKTEATSTGQLSFTDGSLMSLRVGTAVRLVEYKHGGGNPPGKDSFVANVVKGGFRAVTGAIAQNNAQGYAVNTPVGTIGVHGTVYDVFYNAKSSKLSLAIDKGSIRMTPLNGQAIVLTQGTANIGATITAAGARIFNVRPPEVSIAPKVLSAPTTSPETGASTSGGKTKIQVSPCP